MTKVGIYCRLSDEDRNKAVDEDSESIKNQKAMLSAYAMEHGWEIFDCYSDDDYSGTRRDRPGFNRLVQDAKDGKFQIVLCKTQSRFTRELEQVEHYIHGLFPIWGIRFISVVDNIDTEIRGSKKTRQINGLINEWYLEDLSESVKSALTIRRREGYFIGAFAPYGYKKSETEKGRLLPDPPAAEIVRRIFTMYAEGVPKKAIAEELNAKGIPTPSEYKHQCGSNYNNPASRSSIWSYHTVSQILSNEVYIGNLVQGKTCSISYKSKKRRSLDKREWFYSYGTHEAIITKELWDQASSKKSNNVVRSKQLNKYSGILYCGNCGGKLTTCRVKGRLYYRCTKAKEGRCQRGAFISQKELDGKIELNCGIYYIFRRDSSGKCDIRYCPDESQGSRRQGQPMITF